MYKVQRHGDQRLEGNGQNQERLIQARRARFVCSFVRALMGKAQPPVLRAIDRLYCTRNDGSFPFP